MYKIIYIKLLDGKAYLCRRPGKKPYIAFDNGLKGDIDHTLDALVRLMDADRSLTARQKLQKRVIYLEDVNNPTARSFIGIDQPIMVKDQAPDFCRN